MSFEILKPITVDSVDDLFPHTDDLEQVIEAAEEGTLEYVPNFMIVKLTNAGFIK